MTNKGANFVARFFVSHYVAQNQFSISSIGGSLQNGLSLRNAEFADLNGFPVGTILRIQNLDVKLQSLDINDIEVVIVNAQLKMPFSQPILCSGSYQNGQIKFNIFSSGIDLSEILVLVKQSHLHNIRGELKEIDITFSGTLAQVDIDGKFNIKQLLKDGFELLEAPAVVTGKVVLKNDRYVPDGQIVIKDGIFKTPRINFQLSSSPFIFKDSLDNPMLNVKATATVRDIEIFLQVRGTKKNPELKLTSSPSLPEDKLLLMVLTGKSWKAVESSWEQRKVTPDLAKEFIDYLLLGGRGGRLAEKLGIKDVSLIYDENTQGIGIKKELNQNIDIEYGVQKDTSKTEPEVSQKVGTEVKINKSMSVSVDREFKQVQDETTTSQDPTTNDKVLLKYKKSF